MRFSIYFIVLLSFCGCKTAYVRNENRLHCPELTRLIDSTYRQKKFRGWRLVGYEKSTIDSSFYILTTSKRPKSAVEIKFHIDSNCHVLRTVVSLPGFD